MIARGHDVEVITNPLFAQQVEAAGLGFVPVGSVEDYEATIRDPGLFAREESFEVLFRRTVVPMMRPTYDAIARRYIRGDTVVVAATLALGARLAQDHLGVPVATMHVYPAPLRWLNCKPEEISGMNLTHATAINAVRAELGLGPVWDIHRGWWDSPLQVIGAFPSWLAKLPANCPPHLRFGGFLRYDESDTRAIPADVERFLDNGAPSVAFVPASAGWCLPEFVRAAADVCRTRGWRGLLLSRSAAQFKSSLPDNALACGYAAFSRVFPKCRAVVHQGAIGTAALAMAAGVPQVSIPIILDQLDNAEQLQRLGVARTLEKDVLTGDSLAAALEGLLDDPKVAQRCERLAARLLADEPIGRTCALVESLKGRDRPPHPAAAKRNAFPHPRRLTVNLIAAGTYGDVHPFVGIARSLRQRGHRPRLIANPYFREMIERAGVEHVPLGTTQDYLDLVGDPNLWAGAYGHVVGARMCARMMRTEYEVARDVHADDPEAVLLACNFCLGARLAAEALGQTRMATLHISPYSIHNIDDDLMFERMLSTVIATPLNDLRAKAGLLPLAGGVWQWWESPRCVIGMFPEWLSPVRSGWPAQTRLIGFPFYDQHDQHATEGTLEEFLGSGDPPIAFTPGTGMLHGESFFRESADACRRLGRRGILLTRHRAHVPSELPPGVIHVRYAPFGQLFPRCCAVVHHGGMGTLAQALAAGVPQLLMPMSHDQPVNAGCAAMLGVATIVPPNRYTAESVAEALSALLTSPLVAARCHNVVEAFRYNRGAEEVCDIVEELAQDLAPSSSASTARQAIGAAI